MRRLLLILGILFLASHAFAAGGTCPSGSTYGQNLNQTLSAIGVTSCYYVADSGLDTNTGTDESHPWLHAPGMTSCSNNCSSATISAGTGIILRGGDVWHFGNSSDTPYTGGLTWSFSHAGTGSNYNYIGVDPTWFSGGSFARPQLNGDNPVFNGTSFPTSCTGGDYSSAHSILTTGTDTQVDNLEITGVCWNINISSNVGQLSAGSNNYITNMWIHGYTMTSTSSDLIGLTITGTGSIYNHDLFDGSDAPHWPAGSTMCTNSSSGVPCDTGIAMYSHCSVVENSVFHYVRVGGVCNDVQLIHDNTFEFQAGAPTGNFESNQHDDAIMYFFGNTSASGITMQFYNNVIRHNWIDEQFYSGVSGGSTIWMFNNVWYDNHNSTPANAWNLNAQSSGTQTLEFINNTVDNDTDNSSGLTNGVQISVYGNTSNCGNSFGIGWNGPINAANNHLIGYSNLSSLFSGRCGTTTFTVNDNGGNVVQSTTTARSQGYVQSSSPLGDYPQSTSGATVGAGTNLTSTCATASSDNQLCSGTNGGASNPSSGSLLFPTITAPARASSGSCTVGTPGCWDAGAYMFQSAGAAFTCTPGTIPSNHSTNISLACTATGGLTWTSGTTFTVGSPGTFVSKTFNSSTSYTIVVTTTSGTGTSTITDTTDSVSTTVRVSTASVSISPTTGSPGSGGCTSACQGNISPAGTNTLWSTDITAGNFTSSTLFSVSGSGCTGDSLGSATSVTNTSASLVLTWGSSACTETITDNSTGATATFTVSAPSLPTVTTGTAGSPTTQSLAVAGSSVSCSGSCTAVTSEGVCYSTASLPTTPCTSDGTSSPFNSTLTGLVPNTTYNYRAFATNTAGTAYGSVSSFTTPAILYVNGAGASSTSSSSTWTFTYAAAATGNAVTFDIYCHGASTVASATLTASGWTIYTPSGNFANNGGVSGAAFFAAVAPNTSTATFTVEFFTSGAVAVPCASFDAYMVNEFTGNSTAGGATTFPVVVANGASTGGCNQTAGNITPTSNNNAVNSFCYGNPTGATSPWTIGATDGTGGDVSEYQTLSGGSGVSQTPNYTGTTGAYIVEGVSIVPSGSSYTITASSVVGHGIITSSDSNINCGLGASGACIDSGATGTVTLTFTPSVGFSLTTVTGCTLSGSTCSVSSAATITATFTPQAYPIGPQILVDNNEATDGTLTLPAYELSIQTGTWVGPTPTGCTFNTPYSATCSSVQQALTDVESCRTTKGGNTGFYIDVPPPVIACANTTGFTVPQSSLATTASSYIVVRSTDYASLPAGQVVCDHGIQDNLSTSVNIRLNNPDCTGQNMYYELGPTSTTPAFGGVNTASMTSTTATFTLPSGITFPSSFTVGQFVRGLGFSPTGWNTYWQILSGGNGTSSMTAQACVSGTCVSGLTTPTTTNFTLTQVAVSGGTTTYTGTITGGGSSAFQGMIMTVTGFVTGGNNVSCQVLTSTGTNFTCATTTQANETDPASAASITATFNVDNTLTGRTQLSVNTTTLTAIPATGNNYVLLANGYVAPGVSVVIDSGGNAETVTTLSGPNQNGMIASFTKTHAAGVPVTFCTSGCPYTLANGKAINTSNYNDQQFMWGVTASGLNPSVLTFCNVGVTNSTPYCLTSTTATSVSATMASTTATFTAGSNYAAGFVAGNYLLGSGFTPSGYNTEWLIASGGTGSTSLTATCVSGCSSLANTTVSGTLTLISNIAPDHWMFMDGNIAMSAGNGGNNYIIELNNNGATAVSQLPTHIQFRNMWGHGDYTSLATGANEITTMFHLQGRYGSLLDSKISEALRPGAEGHGVAFGMGDQWKLSNDVVEGTSIGVFCGGSTANAVTIPGFLVCQNMEFRKILSTFPYHWLNMGTIPVSFNPNFASQESLVRKNALEIKEGQYIARVGVIGENVDDSGGQDGPYGDLNNWNSSGGAAGNNYQSTITNGYFASEIGRNLCTGYELTGRGAGSFEGSGGSTLLGGFLWFSNDLFYNVSTNSNPNCPGASTGHDVGAYQIQWTGNVTRNSAGNVATFTATCALQNNVSTCPPTEGFTQTDIAIGDGVVVTGCTDSTFNTPQGTPTGGGSYVGPVLGSYALSGTNGTSSGGLTVVYGNSGTGGGSDSSGTCTLGYIQGVPIGLQMTHLTFVTDVTHALTATESKTDQSLNYAKYNLFRDSIWLGGGWFNNDLSEGKFTENGNWDSTSMTADYLVWVGRTASNYVEYCNNPNFTSSISGCTGAGVNPPTTMYFPSSTTMCGYWNGASACTGSVQNLQVADYHAFAIASSAPIFAGGSEQASDGTSMGANITAIDQAQTGNILVCPSQLSCGTPFPDVQGLSAPPAPAPAVFATIH